MKRWANSAFRHLPIRLYVTSIALGTPLACAFVVWGASAMRAPATQNVQRTSEPSALHATAATAAGATAHAAAPVSTPATAPIPGGGSGTHGTLPMDPMEK